MSRIRKYGGIGLLILLVVTGVQVGASFLVRTRPVRAFLIARLENAFGRPVQADNFAIQLLPMPELEMDGVTIGEDPAFGREYFLRAKRMDARLRWMGLLRGRFQFGTMSLTRPSLILVRNGEGRWNLERWLPPSAPKTALGSASAGGAGSQKTVESTHHLQTIEFDDGRINFKMGDEKRPFAFINVSGSVEQVSDGRWRLRLEAQPWRSGVQLQSTGTLLVVGDVAGTSARLQPARLQVHWGEASLADLFRLITGNDSGLRGEFALDGNASVGTQPAGAESAGEWRFQVQARARQLHRWDLTERSDNPKINVDLKGFWNLANNEARADQLRVELPHSNLGGIATLQTASPANWQAKFYSLSVQGEDLLAWCRAFQPGIAEQVGVSDSISGNLAVSGWPLRWEKGAIVSDGGVLRVPGLTETRVEPFRASVQNGKFSAEGLRVRLGSDAPLPQTKGHAVPAADESLELALHHDSLARQGELKLNFHLADAAPFFKLTSAFGRRLDQGWEYTGAASGLLAWNWASSLKEARRSGSIELSKARLAIAGLNQPLKIDDSRLEWKDGRRNVTITKAEAFGANWSGTIAEASDASSAAESNSNWHFQLHADRLDAADLDRWFGPRARPNWLQRVMASLLGQSATATKPSELLRRVSAEGDLSADTLTAEKIKLAKAHASVQFQDLQLRVSHVTAQWAGGNVRGQLIAQFAPVPHYEVTAEVDRANLAQLPWPSRWAEHWVGTASGAIQLTTGGIGRAELLEKLSGRGKVKLSRIELRGWDVRASTESGVARTGTSRWTSGEGTFEIGEQQVRFPSIRLDAPQAQTQLSGTLGFDMSGHVTFLPGGEGQRGSKVAQASRGLSLIGPLETPKAAVQTVSQETARP